MLLLLIILIATSDPVNSCIASVKDYWNEKNEVLFTLANDPTPIVSLI